jgi:hypothetical protein
MAILQSTSTQNDLVVSFFILAFGYYLIKFGKRNLTRYQLSAGLALGLALLTKGTNYLYGAAIGFVFGVGQLWSVGSINRSKVIRHGWRLALIVILALSLNLGHFSRNTNLYGHPLSTANSRVTTDQFSLSVIYANLIRNGAVQLATPVNAVNQAIMKAVNLLLGPLASQPQSTFDNKPFQLVFFINEDYAGNLFHFLFLSGALLFTLALYKKQSRLIKQFVLSILLALMLFSALIKWQPWVSRLQLPLLIYGTILISFMFSNREISRRFFYSLSSVLIVTGLPFLLMNSMRPVIPFLKNNPLDQIEPVRSRLQNYPHIYEQMSSYLSPFYEGQSIILSERDRLYFMGIQDYYWPFFFAVHEIEALEPDQIGLYFAEGPPWEYNLWVLFEEYLKDGTPEIVHVGVTNSTSKLYDRTKEWPEFVFATDPMPRELYNDLGYQEIYQDRSGYVRVFQRESSVDQK